MKRDLHNGDWKMFRYNINKVDETNPTLTELNIDILHSVIV